MIAALAYAADAAVLGAYALTARGRPVRWFHWANAIGCFPIIASEIVVGAWPALILTAAFGAVGWLGVLSRVDA